MSGYEPVSVADVILAIVRSVKGSVCCRADVEAHPAWKWAGRNPASIPHPARRLEREGLLSRCPCRGRWLVLPAGEARADEAIRKIAARRDAMRERARMALRAGASR